MSNLLPCPFCGATPKAQGNSYGSDIECRGCEVALRSYVPLDKAAEKWNSRVGKNGGITDTMRLNRLLRKNFGSELLVVVNKYGYGSDGKPRAENPVVVIEDRNDIDAVIRAESVRENNVRLKKQRTLPPGRRLSL